MKVSLTITKLGLLSLKQDVTWPCDNSGPTGIAIIPGYHSHR